MTNEFDEVMARRSDGELIAILNSPEGDYKPAAVEAAQRVFSSRKLSEERIREVEADREQQKKLEDMKANEPLLWTYKFLAFIFPGILVLMFAGTFKADGYDRKAKELSRATLYGFGFYIGIVILASLIAKIF
jgi:hypothetical protein